MIKILLFIIVIAFVLMGAGTFYAQRNRKLASVNGEPITVEQYQQEYNRLLANIRSQFQGNISDELIEKMNLKKQALDSLTEQVLLKQSADKLGLHVPGKELVAAITQIPSFQHNGVFNQKQYQYVLRQNHLTPKTFESLQKDSMITGRVKTFVGNSVQVSDSEVRQYYNGENAAINIDVVVFDPAEIKDVKATDAEIKADFKAHGEDYKTEPEIKTRYVRFAPESYLSEVTVTDDGVNLYYSEHPDEFNAPETVTARHILLKLDNKADDALVAKRKKEAESIAEKAKGGEDFEKLAKAFSEGPSKDKGGFLGTFKRGDMVKPFSDAAFSMKPGEISDPVRTRFGWHIIKVEKHEDASVKPLDKVADTIRKKLALEKAKNIAYEKAEAAYDVSYDGDDLVKNAKPLGFTIKETGLFAETKGPSGIADARAFAKAAFSLEKMEISDVREIGGAYYLIQVVEKAAPEIPDLKDVKDRVTADVLAKKRIDAAKQAAKDFLKAAKAANEMAGPAEKAGLQIETTGFFKKKDPIPTIGRNSEIADAAFKLGENRRFPDAEIKSRGKFYVIGYKGAKLPDDKAFETEREKAKKSLVSRKQTRRVEQWIAGLKKRAEIKTFDRYMP
ncbi:MAG: peptidyl-prolyl cis-trans isomerase [Deltaproteobacteria bacterium]|nr:peptidyl-prolyl cis-trans isomerase [Deltaproteobacteria bacterium]